MRNKKKFNEFMNKTIEELKDEKRYGTAHVYQSTLNAFCEFCGCKIVYFHQLNRATLKEFETHLRDKQLSWNTVSTYMRTLRGAYNKAVDQKITTGKLSPIQSRLYRSEKRCQACAGSGGDKQAAERSSSEKTTGRPSAMQGLGKPDVPTARDAFC